MKFRFLQAGFLRNVLTLAGGAAAGQAVTIISAPINTRLYTPSDYGALGAYMSVSGLAATAATLYFHYPIVLTERDEDARALVALSLVSAVGMAALLTLVATFLGPTMAAHLGVPQLRHWFFVLPLSTLSAATGSSLGAWVNRRGAYKILASTRFIASLAPIAVTIGLGLLIDGPTGLLAGLVTSQVALAALSIWAATRTEFTFNGVRRDDLISLARRYKNFPIFTLPTELMSNWTHWLPVHLLVTFSGAHAVGAYSMAARMLGLPATFIGTSVGEVFRQQASADCAAVGHCRPLFRRTVQHSAMVAVPIFLLIALVGPQLFAFVFGPPWRDAGEVARVLAGLFCLQFVVSPVTVLYYVRGRLREDMILHVLVLGAIALGMSVVYRFSSAPLALLGAYAFSYGLMYLVYLIRSHQLAGPV